MQDNSIAKKAAHAASDIDLMIVGDDLTLEEVFSCLAPAEARLARKINPTLYTSEEFRRHNSITWHKSTMPLNTQASSTSMMRSWSR